MWGMLFRSAQKVLVAFACSNITGAPVKATRASAVEAALVGNRLDAETVAAATADAATGMEMLEDIHGSKAYRAQCDSGVINVAATFL